MLSAVTFVQIPVSLLVPRFAARARDQRRYIMISTTLTALGLAGVLIAPTTMPYLWAMIIGVGLGSSFAIGLLLFVLRGRTASDTAQLSAMAQTFSYLRRQLDHCCLVPCTMRRDPGRLRWPCCSFSCRPTVPGRRPRRPAAPTWPQRSLEVKLRLKAHFEACAKSDLAVAARIQSAFPKSELICMRRRMRHSNPRGRTQLAFQVCSRPVVNVGNTRPGGDYGHGNRS